ncbi:MAG TPA: N-acetylmuramoyl-L-alanine amidase [Candidatus Eremiobacteraceae bacterium]|nr:N-acetylmuramoyl-L-alanine amidase [Candidatus Eremiobacteraceae bacterium]
MMIRLAAGIALAAALALDLPVPALATTVTPTSAQVWVAGRQIPFEKLGIAFGDPVAPVNDSGLNAMLDQVAAHLAWQPGTRFVAITRADGELITFTVGSNAVSVNSAATAIPFAPFTQGGQLYLPLLPLARALGLGVRGFHGGYVFVPQILSISSRQDGPRTILHIAGSGVISWHSAYAAQSRARTLTVSFPGFGTDLAADVQRRIGLVARGTIAENGPPGYPTTTLTLALAGKASFVARRGDGGAEMDIVIARDQAALKTATIAATPSAVTRINNVVVSATTLPTATPQVASPTPAVPEPVDTSSPINGVTTAAPVAEPTPSGSPAPSADQRVTAVSVARVPTGMRITLTLSGPVSFSWHRLGDPDDRFWLDLDHAVLVGASRDLDVQLDFIKSAKVSQHLLVPDKVVRLSIAPSRDTDIRVGQVAGTSNQIGIEIETATPAPDTPMAGVGELNAAVVANASPRPMASIQPAATVGDLVVIDPGHGGNDPGSLNPDLGLTEKNLTLEISKIVQNRLQSLGWRVVMTRDGDYEVGDPNGVDKQELQARDDVANAAGATVFVSIHINSSVSTAPNGTTTYYWQPADKAFAQDVQAETVASDGIADVGVKREDFYVIKHAAMPAVLVETAFLSNAHDGTLLQQPAFLDRIAAGIVKGIMDFTGGPHASPTPGPSP